MTPKQRKKIKEHGEKLLAVFPSALYQDPLELCQKLYRIESRLDEINIRACNEPYDEADTHRDLLFERVKVILDLPNYKIPVFVNNDPRGYALKIPDDYMREHDIALPTDFGGYGILAPEITGE